VTPEASSGLRIGGGTCEGAGDQVKALGGGVSALFDQPVGEQQQAAAGGRVVLACR